MNKFTVIGLIGVAQQAASPLPSFGTATTNFPNYPTAFTSTELAAKLNSGTAGNAGSFKNAFYQNGTSNLGGLYGCVRSGNIAFPSQNVNRVGHGGGSSTNGTAASTLSTQGSNKRTFWTHDLAKRSKIVAEAGDFTYDYSPSDAATAYSEQTAHGEIEVCCNAATGAANWTNIICPGGTDILADWSSGSASNSYKDIEAGKRIAIKATQVQGAYTSGSNTFVVAVTTPVAYSWSWNQDIILQSLYQSSAQGTAAAAVDGTVWCDKFISEVTAAATVAWAANNGLDGRTKCAMQFNSDKGSEGPSFNVKTASAQSMLFGWMDWYSSTGLGTNAVIPALPDSHGGFYLGLYPAEGAAVWLNPASGGAQLTAQTVWNPYVPVFTYSVDDPLSYWPGSVGMMQWHNNANNVADWKKITTSKIDSGINMSDKAAITTLYNTFNSSKSSYDSLKTLYDQAITDENARQADFFKATFDAPIAIPTRPCMPDQPPAWWGPMPKFGDALAATPITWASVVTANATTATLKSYPVSDAGSSVTIEGWANAKGYLYLDQQSTAASAENALTLAASGRAFGRLGQGFDSMPANASPFAWQDTTTATKTPTMMLSLLPQDYDNTGLNASASKIELVLKSSAFASLTGFDFPSQPAAASPPTMNNANGAMKIAASLATAAAMVAATL